MSDFDQLPLFDSSADDTVEDEARTAADIVLDANTPLDDALLVYLDNLERSGASHHTIKAFRSDLRLLGRWSGFETPVSDYSTAKLNHFLHWMLTERDKPCSTKTYARRVTTLKNFFNYLSDANVIPRDPAAAIIQKTVQSPLPDVLLNAERELVWKVTMGIRADPHSPDARPHVLVTLLLETGIKKAECMALRREDFLRERAAGPQIWIRYDSPKMRYKERKIDVSGELLEVLDEYLAQRRPEDVIFDCTPRNLEYVLRDVALAAGIEKSKLSFETLRWTCAYTDFVAGMDRDRLREKLGLSRISWRDTSARLAELADMYGEDVPENQEDNG